MKCNWKVFIDNYLDGGYHVEVLHKDLTTALNIDSYSTEVGEGYSIQVEFACFKIQRKDWYFSKEVVYYRYREPM